MTVLRIQGLGFRVLKCKRPARGNDTLRIPADFLLEDDSVYKVRNKDVADAMMVLLVANR